MAPYYFKPDSVESLADCCAEIAAACPNLPFYYYNIPSMSGVDFPMVDFLRDAGRKIPNLAGVKFTFERLNDYELARVLDGGKYDVLFGRDEMLLAGLALGATGGIGSTYNVAAPLYLRIIEAFNGGDIAAARELQHKSMRMIAAMLSCASVPVVTKWLMGVLGVDCGPVRPPLRSPSEQELSAVRRELEAIGFFEWCSK